MIRSSNPALNQDVFVFDHYEKTHMTVQGTTLKTGVLLALVLMTAIFSWTQALGENPSMSWLWIGLIGGFVTAMITIFKKTLAPVTAPIYALFEGLLLGGISALFDVQYQGIVFQAVALTFGTMGVLLAAYMTGLIRATENFKLGVVAATGGIAVFYLISLVLRMFGIEIPMIYGNGLIGIGFSVFVVIIAALNLVLDFDFIEKGADAGAPKYMEWYAAFGLLVTLIWLYLEILRLLAKLNSRR